MSAKKPKKAEPDRGRVAGLVKKMVYKVGTGVWKSGVRLPSTREAAREWGVTQLTALRAYKQLEALGLVESRARSGYFVSTGRQHVRLVRHQASLEKLYYDMVRLIEQETDLLPLSVLRYMVRLAEEQARPHCAFLECTQYQADDLAGQITKRFQLPCMPITTDNLLNPRVGLADHIQILITTGFHVHEARTVEPNGVQVLSVPIVFDPQPFEAQLDDNVEVLVLSITRETAQCLADEIGASFANPNLRLRADECSAEELTNRLAVELPPDTARNQIVILSTSLWTALDGSWRNNDSVLPCAYHIIEDAWPEIADVLGLPLGGVG